MKPLPYARQSVSRADIAAVTAVLRSDWLTQGPAIERFERAVSKYCGAKHAVAVANGTAGLHLACLALGLRPGDEVWTSPNTFVASANCALYCWARVDFVDIDPRTYNISVEKLSAKLAEAKKRGRLPKIVIPVHFAGQPCEMRAIGALARKYRFRVIEDASHAIGAKYLSKPIGDCRYSDAVVFSFHPVKIITTGEGGMVLTRHSHIYERLARLRTHGITRDRRQMDGESHGPWYYQQVDLGFNYRITDIQAALGLSQLKRINKFIARRKFLAKRYNKVLRNLPLTLPQQHPDTSSARHLYVVRLQLDRIRKTHRQVFEALRAAGIGVNLHYIPVHTQPYYRHLGFVKGQFPEAEKYYAEAISLPMFYELAEADQNRVAKVLKQILAA